MKWLLVIATNLMTIVLLIPTASAQKICEEGCGGQCRHLDQERCPRDKCGDYCGVKPEKGGPAAVPNTTSPQAAPTPESALDRCLRLSKMRFDSGIFECFRTFNGRQMDIDKCEAREKREREARDKKCRTDHPTPTATPTSSTPVANPKAECRVGLTPTPTWKTKEECEDGYGGRWVPQPAGTPPSTHIWCGRFTNWMWGCGI